LYYIYKQNIKEEDMLRSINFYGLMKLVAEQVALSLDGNVIRVSAVYGPGPGRPNFEKIVWEKLSRGEIEEATVDQFLLPTFNLHIGRALAKILRLGRDIDILHVAGPRLSRYDYALLVARVFNLKSDLIKSITMDKIPYKAPRPRDSSLDNSRAKRYTELSLNDVESALKEYESYQQFSKF
jgi:dTDP-4-dehydrorhamnose reductase